MFATLPLFAPIPRGEVFRLRVRGAPTRELASAVARGLDDSGYASILSGPVVVAKSGRFGSSAMLRADRDVTHPIVKLYSNLIVTTGDSRAYVFIESDSSSIVDRAVDALTLGPVRRAAQSGVAAVADAPGNIGDAASAFGQGVGESLSSIASPLGIVLAIIGVLVVAGLIIFVVGAVVG